MPDIPPSTFKRDMVFGRNRVEPRRFGVWRYGVGRYSPSDPTRFAWSRVKPAAIALLLAFMFALPAAAADTFTPALSLQKPDVDVEDPTEPWGAKINRNFDTLDDAICDKRTGCTINGQLTVITTITASAIIAESSVSVQAPLIGDGLIGTPIGVDSSSVTLLGPTIDAGELPADGYASTYVNTTGDESMTGNLRINGALFQGKRTNVQIRALVCSGGIGDCFVISGDQGDMYISTGTLAGQYRNARTGVGP